LELCLLFIVLNKALVGHTLLYLEEIKAK